MNKTSPTKEWELTQEALDKFLLRLDPNVELAGEKYEQLHRALINFFSHKGCSSPEELADEAINRAIRKIDEGENIDNVVAYTWGVARNVLKEAQRAQNQTVSIDDLSVAETPIINQTESGQESEKDEIRRKCMRRCWRKLPGKEQQLLREWHCGAGRERIENHRRLAERLRIKIETLRRQIFEITQKLWECRTKCLMGERLKKTRGQAK